MNSRILSILCLGFALNFAAMPLAMADSVEDLDESAEQFSDGELAQILAPIALYPDSLLTHVLVASTYPIEIVEAERWLKNNSQLEGGEALEAAQDKDWDPSVKALTPFPRVLSRMSDDLAWTRRVGDAFLEDEKRVLAAIQDLRQQAKTAGNLDEMENLQVEHDEEDNIVIAPKEQSVVYVPYYDTRVVYGHWRWPSYRPIYWDWHWAHHHHRHHHVGHFYWHPRVTLADLFFFSAFNWRRHHVVIIKPGYRHRYWHRRDIIRHNHAYRWVHRPVHRRGVAYRHETVRARYRDQRPSRAQTRAIRRHESRVRERAVAKPRTGHRAHRHSKPAVETRAQRVRNELRNQRSERPARGVRQRVENNAKPHWQVKNPKPETVRTKGPRRELSPQRERRTQVERSSRSDSRPQVESKPPKREYRVNRKPPPREKARAATKSHEPRTRVRAERNVSRRSEARPSRSSEARATRHRGGN